MWKKDRNWNDSRACALFTVRVFVSISNVRFIFLLFVSVLLLLASFDILRDACVECTSCTVSYSPIARLCRPFHLHLIMIDAGYLKRLCKTTVECRWHTMMTNRQRILRYWTEWESFLTLVNVCVEFWSESSNEAFDIIYVDGRNSQSGACFAKITCKRWTRSRYLLTAQLLIVVIDQLRCGSGPRYRHDSEAIGFDGKCRYRTNIYRTSCNLPYFFRIEFHWKPVWNSSSNNTIDRIDR